MNRMKHVSGTILVLLVLGLQSLSAQNTALSGYAGEYSCLSHGVAGLRIESGDQGHKLVLCKDLVTNDCQEHALHKTLGGNQDLMAATGDAGGPLKGLTATFNHQGAVPILEIRFPDGLLMEFVRR
jgi:hypothetical protein